MKGITVRSILIGLAIVVFVNVASPYTESRAFSNFSWSYLPEGGMIPFLFVLFLNLLLRRFLPRSALTSGELLRFLWWPIHPIGLAVASSFTMYAVYRGVFCLGGEICVVELVRDEDLQGGIPLFHRDRDRSLSRAGSNAVRQLVV